MPGISTLDNTLLRVPGRYLEEHPQGDHCGGRHAHGRAGRAVLLRRRSRVRAPYSICWTFPVRSLRRCRRSVFDLHNVAIRQRRSPTPRFGRRLFISEFRASSASIVPLQAYSDLAAKPAQRFFNLLCMAYGADPILFADVVERNSSRKSGPPIASRIPSSRLCLSTARSPHIDRDRARQVMDKTWLPDVKQSPLA